jgi:3-methyl-2-oxobutanoate hydroxymethyltransferase
VAEAGTFAVVLEAITEPLAQRITSAIDIPTIGIGASSSCDGQILVMEDMLGLSPRVPRFVKKFGKVGEVIEGAIRAYAEDVRTRAFPTPEHTYAMKGAATKPAKSRVPERVGSSAPATQSSARRATKKPKNLSSKA